MKFAYDCTRISLSPSNTSHYDVNVFQWLDVLHLLHPLSKNKDFLIKLDLLLSYYQPVCRRNHHNLATCGNIFCANCEFSEL